MESTLNNRRRISSLILLMVFVTILCSCKSKSIDNELKISINKLILQNYLYPEDCQKPTIRFKVNVSNTFLDSIYLSLRPLDSPCDTFIKNMNAYIKTEKGYILTCASSQLKIRLGSNESTEIDFIVVNNFRSRSLKKLKEEVDEKFGKRATFFIENQTLSADTEVPLENIEYYLDDFMVNPNDTNKMNITIFNTIPLVKPNDSNG